MKKYLVDGVGVHFLEENAPQSKTIIFIHGNSHSARSFHAQMNSPLLKDYRLISVDLPGHGESSRLSKYSLGRFAQLIASLIEELSLKDFVLVGHSLGGHVCINTLQLKLNPKGIFIFGTPPLKNPFDPGSFIVNFAEIALGQLYPTDKVIGEFADLLNYRDENKRIAIDDYKMSDPIFRETILDDVLSSTHADEIELVNSFHSSVMFLLATNESVINNKYITREFSSISRSNLEFKEINSGHSPHVECSDEFNALLSEFCNKVFNNNMDVDLNANIGRHDRGEKDEQRN